MVNFTATWLERFSTKYTSHDEGIKDGTMEKVLFRISKIFKSEGGFSIIVRDVFEWQKMEETQSLSLPPKAVAWELHMISLCFCFGQRG